LTTVNQLVNIWWFAHTRVREVSPTWAKVVIVADPSIMSFQFQDDGKVPASNDYFIAFDGSILTLDAAIANVQATALLVDAMSDAKMTGIRLVIVVPLPSGLKGSAVADSSVEKTGLFNFSLDGSKYSDSIDIPAIANSLVTNKRINLTAGAYTAWRDRVLDDTSGLHVISKFNHDLAAVIDAAVTFRKHRKSTRKASFEVAG